MSSIFSEQDVNDTTAVRVKGIEVDVDALLRVRHTCDPVRCKNTQCCCQAYEVCFTEEEMERAVGLMPQCSAFAPHLAEGEEFESPFEETEDGLLALDAQEDGACAFAYRDEAGVMWCAMHSAALSLGLSPWEVKAQVCMLWPLALSEGERPVLGVQEGIEDFPCNQLLPKPLPALHSGVADCILRAFGSDFLCALQEHIATL